MEKYRVGLDRPDINTLDWLRHAQEEALDLAVYLRQALEERKSRT